MYDGGLYLVPIRGSLLSRDGRSPVGKDGIFGRSHKGTVPDGLETDTGRGSRKS